MRATKRGLIGRRIVGVDFHPFRDVPRGITCHNPIIKLDNGRELYFVTEETETGEYGTFVGITEKQKRGGSKAGAK